VQLDRTTTPQKSLLAEPQPFGILPTWWFWNDRETWRRVGWGFAILIPLITVVAMMFAPSVLAAVVVSSLISVLTLGALEKYVRHHAAKRQLRSAANGGDASHSAR
jgi:hypothetical protein